MYLMNIQMISFLQKNTKKNHKTIVVLLDKISKSKNCQTIRKCKVVHKCKIQAKYVNW